MGKGWISIHRKIREHWLWENDKPFDKRSAWIDMILMANHKDRKVNLGNELIVVKCGSFITSIRKLCERWGWSNTKVYNFLDLLKQDNMIEYKSDTKKTLITIVNYEEYQNREYTKTTQKRHKSDTKTTQKHTNNNENNDNNKKIYIQSEKQKEIFNYWLQKDIIKHRKLSDKFKRAINGALRDYSVEEIKKAIDNYDKILNDDRYFFSYKWTIQDFLQRGLEKFIDFEVAHNNYIKEKPQTKDKPQYETEDRAYKPLEL